MRRLLLGAVVLLFLFPTMAFATGMRETPENPTAAQEGLLPTNPELRIGRLANGLTYIIRENERPDNRGYLRLVVNAGSVLEDPDQLGLAHFAEHMAFNGTEDFSGNEIVAFLERLGMEFGPDINAYTSFDETVYYLEIPTVDDRTVESAFHVLQQWAAEIAFTAEEIDKERGVILEEWRIGRGAQARMSDEQLPILFRGSRYAERLPIGDPDVIRNFEYETIRRFYRDWYRPDLMAVIAVGDFNADGMEALIREYFADIEMPENPRTRTEYDVPPHQGTLYAIASDPEAQANTVSVYTKQPAEDLNTIGDYRRGLIESLFTITINRRFSEIAQEADAPFLEAGAGEGRLVRPTSAKILSAAVEPGGFSEGLKAVVREVLRIQRHGFTAGELDRVKRDLLRSYEIAYNERDKTNSQSYASEYTRLFLESEASPGIEAEYELARRLLPQIRRSEVEELAFDYLTGDNRVIMVNAVEGPDNRVPTEDELGDALAAVEAEAIAPYQDQVRDEPLIAEPPQPGRITEERVLEEIDATEWTLSNGATVVVKPTDFQDDEVLLYGFSPGGTSVVADEDYRSARQATSVIQNAGVGSFTRVELGKQLAGKAVSVAPFIDETTEGIRGSASPADLTELFQLAHLYVTSPREDPNAYESYMRRLENSLRNRDEDPNQVFFDEVRATLGNDHPRRKPLTIDELPRVDYDRVYEVYRDRFADAGEFTFVIVGAVSENEVRPLVEQYIATLPATGRNEGWGDPGITRPDGVVEETVESGVESQSRTSLIFHGPYDWSVEENYRIRTMAEVFQIRLREVLREEQSGTYAVGAFPTLGRYPREEWILHVAYFSAPERAYELTDYVFQVAQEIKNGDVDDDYLTRVTKSQVQDYETSIETNTFWRDAIRDAYFHDLAAEDMPVIPELADEITMEDVSAAARRYINEERYIHVTLFPEGWEAE
ncbi:MAG: M16 family metallopeptidase [Spirochaetota bacterium]